ncbi:hypothetical protein GJU39_02900 [Pedobacter petrophilus]|uniref:Uncharacterized protein n=1 Tax=Pedobacter petrophilus TaxID=1908241 RepID=A0A7K0FWB0_9SPHI|nr:hypothetical protein [Pedobacter petrophilus]MRX75026.1 hypothetical protein [Pedobacter petrophilus]
MRISKEALEHYHQGACTPAERKAVEEWLLSTSADDLLLPPGEDKYVHKAEMWNNIRSVTDETETTKSKSSSYYVWKGAIAASMVICMLAAAAYFLLQQKVELLSLNNNSAYAVKQVNSIGYDVSVGPNTIASINDGRGIIYLNGSVLILANKDVQLVLEGTKTKISLKKGQSYIIFKNKTGSESIIVVNKQDVFDLPPLMQRQITKHFDI